MLAASRKLALLVGMATNGDVSSLDQGDRCRIDRVTPRGASEQMRGIGPTHRVGATSATFAVVALLAVGLAGCGGSDDDQLDPRAADSAAVRAVLGELQEASRAGDGELICTEIFTPTLANAVSAAGRSGSCAQEVRRHLFSPKARLTVKDIIVNDPANATATVREANGNTSTVFFFKQSGRWRIRSVQPARR